MFTLPKSASDIIGLVLGAIPCPAGVRKSPASCSHSPPCYSCALCCRSGDECSTFDSLRHRPSPAYLPCHSPPFPCPCKTLRPRRRPLQRCSCVCCAAAAVSIAYLKKLVPVEMAERLHYFSEATTPITFEVDDSDNDEDESRRPTTELERNKHHAGQFQLWSDEARRRRTVLPPQRRPSTSSLHDVPMVVTNNAFFPVAMDERAFRASIDRQQSNLSDRSRNPPGTLRLSQSSSGKNLRIRITPSSSTKSLTSDIDSDSSFMPNSPLKQTLTYSTLAPHPSSRKFDDSVPSNLILAQPMRKSASAADLRTHPTSTSVSPRYHTAVFENKRPKSSLKAPIQPSASASEYTRYSSRPAASRANSSYSPTRRAPRPGLLRNSISRLKRFLLNR